MFRYLLYNLKNKKILETNYPQDKTVGELFRIIKITTNQYIHILKLIDVSLLFFYRKGREEKAKVAILIIVDSQHIAYIAISLAHISTKIKALYYRTLSY